MATNKFEKQLFRSFLNENFGQDERSNDKKDFSEPNR